MDSAHIMLLSQFVKIENENYLGNGGSEFDAPVQPFQLDQIEIALPEYRDQLAELLAGLQGHGLFMVSCTGGGHER